MRYKKLKNDSFLLVQSTLNIYNLAYHLNDVLSIYLKRESNKKINEIPTYHHKNNKRILWSLIPNETNEQKTLIPETVKDAIKTQKYYKHYVKTKKNKNRCDFGSQRK